MRKYSNSKGILRKADKHKERAPDLVGEIEIERHTLEAIVARMAGKDKAKAKLAAWAYKNGNAKYLSVVLSAEVQEEPEATATGIEQFFEHDDQESK